MECNCKTKRRTEEEIRNLKNRLSRIEGQIRGISRMIDDDAYCTDVLIQTAAATSALRAFEVVVLNNHIRTCVCDGIKSDDPAVVDELTDTVKKLLG